MKNKIMKINLLFVFIFLYNILFIDSVVSNEIQVKTSSGLVKGLTTDVLNQSINQFLGIPFAEPPVGKLRFSIPKELQKPIEGVIDGTIPKKSCMQPKDPNGLNKNLTISEDCLVLNVWSPQTPTNETSKLKPVMFWIYGGALSIGSINQYIGSILATHDIVFVAPNYRLGPFGFLYGATKDSPGNLGFYDQLLALKWVRENIHLFGGDKNQITIFGESAGSWSVSAHILSPLSKGLFKRAIMESGADFHNKMRGVLTTDEALKQTKDMAKHFNCSQEKEMLDCLRDIDAHSILDYTGITTFPLDNTEFLPKRAQDILMTSVNYSYDIDLIAGVTRNEGSLLALWSYDVLRGNFTENDFKDLVEFSNIIFHDINVEKVIEFYLKNVDKNNTNSLKKAFYDFYGDILIKCPTYLFAKQFSENNPKRKTYFYELSYESSIFQFGCDEKTMGICHASDVPFVFGVPLYYDNWKSKLDIDFSIQVMKMWTNFAKDGNPGQNWPQMIDHGQSVVKNLNPRDLNGVLVDPFKKDCDEFWKNYF